MFKACAQRADNLHGALWTQILLSPASFLAQFYARINGCFYKLNTALLPTFVLRHFVFFPSVMQKFYPVSTYPTMSTTNLNLLNT